MSVPTPPAAPSPQQMPPPMPPAGVQGAEPKKNNVVALVALIVAAVGFIFACIPGALVVGWILLPIAFVLSIVSLFLKGDRKWMGIVGLIVSIIGTIVGFIVFFAVVLTAAGEALDEISSGETTVTQTTDEDAETATEEGSAASADQGTRENPYPLASQISSDDWTVVVNSYTTDGNPVVSGANEFNEAAPAGSHYEVINYTVTYTGDESGLSAEVGIALVTSAGNVVNSYDALVLLTDPIGLDELYTGASATGSAAFLVPDGETALIRVRPGMLADEVFVQP
ncbi:hypothetical protein ACTU6V_04120 [Microbacterium sp. A204]|uniref:hypothetical protein n=1 Tax=Microbacterium sp. A204 TaxID=3457321 RepID=UPI003FCF4534